MLFCDGGASGGVLPARLAREAFLDPVLRWTLGAMEFTIQFVIHSHGRRAMNHDDWPFRSVYLDPDLDDQLRDQAAALGVGKAEFFRQRLKAGMKAARGRPDLLIFAHCPSPLVLRAVRMDPKVDHALVVQAFERRRQKNDLIRVYTKLGLAL